MTDPTPGRIARDARIFIVVVVGLALMGFGGYGVYVALHERPIDLKLVWTMLGVVVVGALLLPSVFDMAFPRVKAIYLLIFPNGLPMLGGRRVGDPQPTQQPPPPTDQPPPPAPWPPPNGGAG